MLHIVLQVWGGGFYLLNKIFFSRAERSEEDAKRIWRIRSWTVYLIGVPAWLIIFVIERNWMVAAVEMGGMPAMVLGLVIARRGIGKEPNWLSNIARFAAILGIAYSLYDFGGITTLTQTLELVVVAGFLIGTYLLARQQPAGYLWFLLMNISAGTLMFVQDYPWLALQQVISFGFVADAYFVQKRKSQLEVIRKPRTA